MKLDHVYKAENSVWHIGDDQSMLIIGPVVVVVMLA